MNSKNFWLKRAAAITFVMPLVLISACGGSGTPAPTIPSNVYRIGGTISGLADGNSITLTNNGGDAVTKSTNGSFRFSNALVDGSNFKIAISSLPNNQPCTSTYNTGTVNGATIDHINVFCGPVPNSGVKATTPMAFPLHSHAATVLIDGSVLVTGGVATITTNFGAPGSITSSGVVPYAHIYNATTKVWKGTPTNMAVARQRHTSTLVDGKLRLFSSGKVLIVGGSANNGALSSAEIYDVDNATWSAAASLNVARFSHTATVLDDGRILVVGGLDALGTQNISSAEIYDSGTNTWTVTASTLGAHGQHTATLLPNGKVLVVGWNKLNPATNSAEIYDPATGQWSATGNLAAPRSLHTATLLANGKVLVAGGVDRNTPLQLVSTFETYDPTTGIWTTEGSGSARSGHTAAALFNDKVLLSGGYTDGLLTSTLTDELYDPTTKSITPTTAMLTARFAHTASVLGNGEVLLAGGVSAIPAPSYTAEATAKADLYGTRIAPDLWDPATRLEKGAVYSNITLLQNGKVLLAGGYDPSLNTYSGIYTNSPKSQIFDEITGLWSATGSLAKARSNHAATLLSDGRVLVTGGVRYAVAGDEVYSELFDPTSGLWSKAADISKKRIGHTSTRLLDGRVLIAGGNDASAEIFNPNTNTWVTTASMNHARFSHTATLLPNGKILVVGGNTLDPIAFENNIVAVNAAAELFDPATGTWSFTGPVAQVRGNHQATLLPDGKVLVSGGRSKGANNVTNTEVYDPATNTWATVGNIFGGRYDHTATLLPNGKVLINGGAGYQHIATAALFDPSSGNWTVTTAMYHPRSGHKTTLLPSGRALSAAGSIEFFGFSLNPIFSEIFW
jgi:large repetitive protein